MEINARLKELWHTKLLASLDAVNAIEKIIHDHDTSPKYELVRRIWR